MAQGNTQITIKINGKEVEDNIYSIRKAVRELNTDINKMNRSAEGYNDAIKEYQKANNILKDHTTKLSGVNKSWENIKENIKAAGIVMIGYFGVSAVFSKMQNALEGAAKMSDVMADVQRTTGMTADETEHLKIELAALDTRTATVDLLDLAKAGGKLGIAEEDILGFVKAADQINVALGEDLGKDAITAIGKIVNIFHLKDEFGLEQAMLKVGSAINSAGQASEAQEGYIVDFLNRMGGVAPLANISATSIIGLGATLDSLGQTSEVSSTALSKMFTKMAEDADTYAKFAGMSVEEFTKLLNEDAMEAFIRVLEGSNKTSGGIVNLTKTLGEMDVEGGRAVGVFGTLANNTQRVREQIDIANKSFKAGTSITQEYSVKNETLAASMDKLMKQLNGFIANSLLTHALTDLVGYLGDTRTEVEKTTQAYELQKTKTAELEKNLNPLVQRYNELKTQGSLNKEEQIELNGIIQKISDLLPTASTGFDQYGNAIDISTEKVNAAIARNRELVQALGEKDIAALTKEVKALGNEASILQSQLNKQGVTEKVKDFDPKTNDTYFRRFSEEEMTSVKNEMLRLNEEMYASLLRLRDEFQMNLSADQVNFMKGWDEFRNKGSQVVGALTEEQKQLAAAQQAAEELKSETQKKEAEKRAAEYKRQTEQLNKFIQQRSQELLLFGLDQNERELQQIRNKYADEIALAKGHAEQLKEIETLRDQEIEMKRFEHQQKLLAAQGAFNEEFWLMLADEETKSRASIDKFYEDWYIRMAQANLDTQENWDALVLIWEAAVAKFDQEKYTALGVGLAKGLQNAFANTAATIDTKMDYSTKKYRELVDLAAQGDSEAGKVLENMNDLLASQAEGYFKVGQAAADSVELQKLTLKDLLNVIRQQIKAYIADAVAKVVADVLLKVPFPLNIALATTAGFTTSALFDKLIPKFAGGGYTAGERMYIAGEEGTEYIANNKQINDPVTGPLIRGLEYNRTTGRYPEWMTSPTYLPNMAGISQAISYSNNPTPGYFGSAESTGAPKFGTATNTNNDIVLRELNGTIKELNQTLEDMRENGIQAILEDERISKIERRLEWIQVMAAVPFI